MKTLKQSLVFVFAAFLLACTNENYEEPPVREKSQYARFAVISDIHVGRSDSKEKIEKTLKSILNKGAELDALFIVGDITDTSKDNQYNGLIHLFNMYAPKNLPVYYMLGNHDVGWVSGDPLTLYTSKLGQPLHQYIKIKGLPFITVSLTDVSAVYGQEQKDFLSAALEDASTSCPGCPIFVFAHVGVTNTVYGTAVHEGWGCDSFSSILSKYPQAIVFSGHSHFPIGDPRSIHQSKFTSVNLGSCTYSEIEPGFTEGINPPGNMEVTEGVIVTTNERNDVQIERWDTFRDEEILPRWVVNAPHDGTAFAYANRTGGSAPTFKSNDKPVISKITDTGCTVSFPQATDDEVVHHYILEAVNNNGKTHKSITIFSRFYLNSAMPASLEINFPELQAGTEYTIQITAVDSYQNKSTKIISSAFTTSKAKLQEENQLISPQL